jgi:hypothetical protein
MKEWEGWGEGDSPAVEGEKREEGNIFSCKVSY